VTPGRSLVAKRKPILRFPTSLRQIAPKSVTEHGWRAPPRAMAIRPARGNRKTKGPALAGPSIKQPDEATPYIIPDMSGMPPPGPPDSFSGTSATMASVVRMFLAIDAAF